MFMSSSYTKEEVKTILTSFYKKQKTHKRNVAHFVGDQIISNDCEGLGDTVILTPFTESKTIYSSAPDLSGLMKYNDFPSSGVNVRDTEIFHRVYSHLKDIDLGPEARAHAAIPSEGVFRLVQSMLIDVYKVYSCLHKYLMFDWGGGHRIQIIARALGLPEITKPQGVLNCQKAIVKNRVGYHMEGAGRRESIPFSQQTLKLFNDSVESLEEYDFHNLSLFNNDLDGLINFLATCEYFIGINSGPMHIAAALDVKSIVIVNGGPEDATGNHGSDPALLYLPKIKEMEAFELDWLYPQNTHLHVEGSNELVPLFSKDSLKAALKGNVYPYFKDDFLDITYE